MNAKPQRLLKSRLRPKVPVWANPAKLLSARMERMFIIAPPNLIIELWLSIDNSQLNKYRISMSTSKARRRNRDKKFFEKEEDQIGVMDESNVQYKNKIEEKQEDMFDPHKLQQNILKETEKSYQNNFIDFGDEDIVEAPIQEPLPQKQNILEEEEKAEESTIKKNTRKRGAKREKKTIIDSDEDIKESQLSQIKKGQETFSQLTVQDNLKMLKRQQSIKRDELEEQEQDQGKQQETIQQMVKRKNQVKTLENYVLMHSILNKAGFNKAERKTAIYTPLNPGEHSFVYFKRYQSGFSEYYQAIGEDQRPILFCENQRGCIGCNYYISLTKEMDKNNPAYLGKLRGNASGSIYQLYDSGLQPNSDIDRSKFRVSMAFIEYQSNFMGMKGPRKLKAIVPNTKGGIEQFDLYKLAEEESLNNFQPPTVINLRNKQPRWNDRLKSYALNFGGRVKQASIKNFILTDDSFEQKDEDKAPNIIVFGKIDQNTFALEFRHPLNLFQAFGIAMSEFDFKLKCE